MRKIKSYSVVGLAALSFLLTFTVPTYGLLPADDFHRTLCGVEIWPDTYAVKNETWNGYKFYNNQYAGSYADVSLDQSVFYSGNKSLRFAVNSGSTQGYAIMYNSAGWDFSEYDILRFYVKGDAANQNGTLRIDLIEDNWRVSGGYLSTRVETIGATQFAEWTAIDIDLTQVAPEYLDNIKGMWLWIRDLTGEGNLPVMWYDNVLLIKTISEPSFQYTGVPCQMKMSFAHANADSADITLRYGLEGQTLDNEVVLPNVPGDPRFEYVLNGLIPFRTYDYQLDDGTYVAEGSFSTESISLDTLIIEDFEGYADTADMENSGRFTGLNMNSTLITDPDLALDGSNSGAFMSNNEKLYAWAGINYLAGPTWDLSSYDKLRVWYRFDKDNENRIDFTSYNEVKMIIRNGLNETLYDELIPIQQNYSKWTYYDVEIDDTNPNWSDIGLITFNVDKLDGSEAYPRPLTVYIDRVEAIRDTVIAGDYNANLSVDIDDITLLAAQWLAPSDYLDYKDLAGNWMLDISCGVANDTTDLYISPDGSGHGLSVTSPTNLNNQGIFNVVNESLQNNPVTIWLLDGTYENFRFTLNGIGNETNTLTIKGISEDGVVLSTPEVAGNLLNIRGSRNIAVENLNFTGSGSYGYALAIGTDTEGNPSHDITVSNCNFYDMPEMIYGTFGVHNGSYNVVLENCSFERVGRDSHSHMVYNAYDVYNITITGCYFEDTPGTYVRYRDADFGIITNNTFTSSGTYPQANAASEKFIGFELFNTDPNDPTETFGTNYTVTGNTFNFSPTTEGDERVGINWHHSGYNPESWNYLLTPTEGATLEGTNTQAKQTLLLQNCGIDFSLIDISNNAWNGYVTRKLQFSSSPYPDGYWSGTADISDLLE